MTLTPLRPEHAAASRGGSLVPWVTAVLLPTADVDGLGELVRALRAQRQRPDALVVLDADDPAEVVAVVHRALGDWAVPVAVVERAAGASDRAAVGSWLRAHPVRSAVPTDAETSEPRGLEASDAPHEVLEVTDDLLWLLPEGTRPESGALAALVDTWRRSPSTGIVGPKHVRRDAPTRLEAMAIRVTRAGRVVSRPVPGEPDQGQYDRDADVLAVPMAGALIERSLLVELDGWDRAAGDLGGDLDLGWRAQTTGRRVVVAPGARMRTEPGRAVALANTPSRRRAARRVALTRAPWWQEPLIAAWILVSGVLSSLALLLVKRSRAAWAEFADLGALNPVSLIGARWRTRGTQRRVRPRHLSGLFAPSGTMAARVVDEVHDAVVPPRAPLGDRSRAAPGASLRHRLGSNPGVLAVATVLLATVVAARDWGTGILRGLDVGLVGGELTGGTARAGALWHAWVDDWAGPGLGGPADGGPHLPILAGLARLVEALPLVPTPTSSGGAVVAVLVFVALPLAAASAYLSARVVTRVPWPRAAVAVLWACSPPAVAAVAEGRLGALVALLLLPPVAAGLAAVAARRATPTWASGAGLATAVLGAFAPALAAAAVLLALLLFAVRRGARGNALILAVTPLVLLSVRIRDLVAEPALLLQGPGLLAWGTPASDPVRLAALQPGHGSVAALAVGALIVALGVGGLLRGRGWRAPQTALGVLTLVGVAAALTVARVSLGVVPEGSSAAGEPLRPWIGLFLLPVTLVLLSVALLGAAPDGRVAGPARLLVGWRQVLGAAALAAVGLTAVAGFPGTLAAWRDPRPALAVEQSAGLLATRTLFVTADGTGTTYRLLGREGADLVRSAPVDLRSDQAIADGVVALLADADPTVVGVAAIDLIGLRVPAPPELAARLDGTAGLQEIAGRGGWRYWRVTPGDQLAERPIAPPRLRLETGTTAVAVAANGSHAASDTQVTTNEPARLVVAEPTAWSRSAVVRIEDRVVAADPTADTPTYAVPAGTHRVTIEVIDSERWWHLATVFLLGAAVYLAVPAGRRGARTRQGS